MRWPSSGVASWLLAPPATTGTRSSAMLCSVRIAPSALGLKTSASKVRIDPGGAHLVGEALGAAGIDVGEADPGAFDRGAPGHSAGDASRALHGDVKAVEIVLSECALHRGLEAEED